MYLLLFYLHFIRDTAHIVDRLLDSLTLPSICLFRLFDSLPSNCRAHLRQVKQTRNNLPSSHRRQRRPVHLQIPTHRKTLHQIRPVQIRQTRRIRSDLQGISRRHWASIPLYTFHCFNNFLCSLQKGPKQYKDWAMQPTIVFNWGWDWVASLRSRLWRQYNCRIIKYHFKNRLHVYCVRCSDLPIINRLWHQPSIRL